MRSRACCAVACLEMRSDIKKSVEKEREGERGAEEPRTHHRAHHRKVGDEFIRGFPGDEDDRTQVRAANE